MKKAKKKGEDLLLFNVNRATLFCLVESLIFAIPVSFVCAYSMVNYSKSVINGTVAEIGSLLIPLFFIIFGFFGLLLLVVSGKKEK